MLIPLSVTQGWLHSSAPSSTDTPIARSPVTVTIWRRPASVTSIGDT
jgi:hypothetical protein